MSRDVYIFVGPPGSGKGSLSALCVESFGWMQLSTGNLCRQHIADQTPIGKAIDFAIKSGKLVSDDLITNMVLEWFADQSIEGSQAVILDGYPRTVAQAEAFYRALQADLQELNLRVILFEVDDETVAERIRGRFVCQNKDCQAVYSIVKGSPSYPKNDMICDRCSSPIVRRKDDEGAAVYERLAVYHSHVGELLNFYRKVGISIKNFDAQVSIDELFDKFKEYALCDIA